jgi:hypothetical protein
MAYEIEWHTWEEEVYRGDRWITAKVRLAEITADTMDDLGIAVDEVEKKWGPGTRVTHPNSNRLERAKKEGDYSIMVVGGMRENGLPTGHDRRVSPKREGGRWHILWGC